MDKEEITVLLDRINEGDESAPEKLLPLVYEDLRRLAHHYFTNERSDHTLQATALVHEAYIRLVNWENVSWQNRAHFFSVAAEAMRNVLVDHARRSRAQKRGSGQKVALDEAISLKDTNEVDLVELDDALKELSQLDSTQAKIVEMRFFGGLSIEETAHTLKVSPATVKREWASAKIWLYRKLKNE